YYILRSDLMSCFPIYRPRRLRATANLRSMICETTLSPHDLIYPLFVVPGTGIKNEIETLAGNYQYSVDLVLEAVDEVVSLGIPAIILFGLPSYKDELGSSAWDDKEPVQMATKLIKAKYPELVIIADACLCEYTSHGHCGVLENGCTVNNDETLPLLAKIAVSQARCGADIIAPSNMMDGYVTVMRSALDEAGFTQVAIMAYSAKFASAYYGPFRAAADSTPSAGDRKGYQMDPANGDEALREVELDIEEGADIVMVKPALAYLDVVARVSQTFNRPLCVYNVSGEFAMVKAAAQKGWIDEKRIVLETLTGFKRAGAKMIITYHALEAARWLRE
ncbi:MAG: porphobilinogen synthase, partial [Acidaminococcaceae bacterium]